MSETPREAYSDLAYITFYVRNFQKVLEFYRDTLGLEVEQANDGFVRFRAQGGFGLAFHFADQPVLARPAPEIHFAVADVDAAYRDLQGRGVRFERGPEDMPWGARMAACRDPEGLTVELVGPVVGREA
jgi:catechol 2,3-dioxygenase-like lactoylglutathione lyase family enzyme